MFDSFTKLALVLEIGSPVHFEPSEYFPPPIPQVIHPYSPVISRLFPFLSLVFIRCREPF